MKEEFERQVFEPKDRPEQDKKIGEIEHICNVTYNIIDSLRETKLRLASISDRLYGPIPEDGCEKDCDTVNPSTGNIINLHNNNNTIRNLVNEINNEIDRLESL